MPTDSKPSAEAWLPAQNKWGMLVQTCAGPRAEGTLYAAILRRWCRSLDCGQVRIDKDYSTQKGQPDLNTPELQFLRSIAPQCTSHQKHSEYRREWDKTNSTINI